eukprot:Partr_v1_DN28566_c0_g1_i2_m73335 putative ATPase CA transporting
MKFLDQIKQPLIMLLLGSAFISLLMGQYDDAFSITLAILIVITVAFVQEYRSEKSLEALEKLVPHYCHVLREGHYITVLGGELVPGDIVKIGTGDRVPADLRLVECVELELDESNLTGETMPCSKRSAAMFADGSASPIGITDRHNSAFMGTLVRGGHGIGLVVSTGKDTEFGHIWTMMKDVEPKKTPLQVKMDTLGTQLSMFSFGVIGVIATIGLLRGKPWLDTFTIAVSLAVAAIPEGLPIVVTVTLALGVIRMASKNVIVKQLPSVESLGSVNVICADKTGTLTQNRLSVTQIYTVDGGVQQIDDRSNYNQLRQRDSFRRLAEIANLCNDASIHDDEKQGQQTELALLEFAVKTFGGKDCRSSTVRLSQIPFSSEKKWMAVECEIGTKREYYVKGAPEMVLENCSYIYTSEKKRAEFTSEAKQMSDATQRRISGLGLRVLAVACGSDLNKLSFVGFIGMVDRPRDGVVETVQQLMDAGIRLIMITGDSEGTALSIAKQIGIIQAGSGQDASCAMSGVIVETMEEAELQKAVKSVNVFYRTTPRHKLEIVKALRSNGDVVAMTGDGVNDAPALKRADIGISMGQSGTDVSKEAADVILVDDNLNSLLAAIEEGKSIFYNIRNFIKFQLSTSVAALSLIALSTLFGLPPPLNPMQILWINIIMDGPPAQSLGVEPVTHDVMKEPPRPRHKEILDRSLIIRVLTSAAIIVIGTFYIYYSQLDDGSVTARDTTMTFTTFIMFDMFNCLSSRSERQSLFKLGLFGNTAFLLSAGLSIVCQILVIYMPFFQAIFQTQALHAGELFEILMISSTVFWADELRKYYLSVSSHRSPDKSGGAYEMV